MKVAAVVPAYNEVETVAQVVRVLAACPEIAEVIVVNDGSQDGTSEAARQAGARVIDLPENRGKGAAMRTGYEATDAELILFMDADLIGLTPAHVASLVAPVLAGAADMSIGVFEGGRLSTDLAQVVAPHLSGQRAVRRELLQVVCDLDVTRFGVEVALTRHAKRLGWKVSEVLLPDLTHRMKEEKLGLVRGFLARMRMYWEIVKYAQRH